MGKGHLLLLDVLSLGSRPCATTVVMLRFWQQTTSFLAALSCTGFAGACDVHTCASTLARLVTGRDVMCVLARCSGILSPSPSRDLWQSYSTTRASHFVDLLTPQQGPTVLFFFVAHNDWEDKLVFIEIESNCEHQT